MIQSTFLFNFLIYHDLAMVIMAEIELWCHQRHRRSILLLYFIMQQSISKGKHNLSIFNQFCVWTWRLTLQSPPAAWKRSGTASVTILAIFWPLLSDSCVTILSWHVVTATETICGIVRVAAALRPGYRRPATSHSGAAEAARWPAGTSCPLTEDKCQNRSWCREHTSTFYCMWPIFYDTGTIYILPVFTVSRECLWACQRNQKCYEFQNSEIVLVTPRRKQFNGL